MSSLRDQVESLLVRCPDEAHHWLSMMNDAGEHYRRCSRCSMLVWDEGGGHAPRSPLA